jgi:Tfp pilus assembly protein PilN
MSKIAYTQGVFMKWLLMTSMFFSLQAFAQSKSDVNATLEMMKKKGMFSEAQIAEAQKMLKGMSDSDFQGVINKAEKIKNDPKVQRQLKNLGKQPASK